MDAFEGFGEWKETKNWVGTQARKKQKIIWRDHTAGKLEEL